MKKKWLVGVCAALLLSGAARAGEQVAVKFDGASNAEAVIQTFRSATGADLKMVRLMSGNAWVISLPDNINDQERARILDALRTIRGVDWVEAETHHRTNTLNGGWIPNDPNLAPNQWNLHDPAIPGNAKGAINAVNAWSSSKGDGIVIAIIDNGVNATHPDLQGKMLPGYSFITRTGRGTNTQPPAFGAKCANAAQQNGSAPKMVYHGTNMAGIAAAATNNGLGIAGVAPNASILPVKVMDECQASSFDVADAIRWAAGSSVPGVPGNPNPARVISMSLGAAGVSKCDAVTQAAIADASAKGAVVVVAAGNESGPVTTPATCHGAIAVAGLTYAGALGSYSNFGPAIAVSAPGGGGSVGEPDPVNDWSLWTIGATSYANDDLPAYNSVGIGTSNAVPQVAGVAALMLAQRPALTPAAVRQLLRKSARSFVDSSCNTWICGAGMLDAFGAVTLAAQAVVPNASAIAPKSVSTGTTVALDGSQSSSANVSYAWTQLSGPRVTLLNANAAIASFTPTVAGDYQFGLTVTDNASGLSAGTSVLLSAAVPASTSGGSSGGSSASGDGGGGGAFGLFEAVLLLAGGLLAFAGRRRIR
ncbi:S8 family serine peptidase [Cupriavidus basilensis]|uniref:S8 family serine peptidase n=1 Tax=Cupriavidus basilensis TaxID=68895 RepID=UPI0020A66E89|nr:S8 family serine peptidase [Cupriavidus basilensis]